MKKQWKEWYDCVLKLLGIPAQRTSSTYPQVRSYSDCFYDFRPILEALGNMTLLVHNVRILKQFEYHLYNKLLLYCLLRCRALVWYVQAGLQPGYKYMRKGVHHVSASPRDLLGHLVSLGDMRHAWERPPPCSYSYSR